MPLKPTAPVPNVPDVLRIHVSSGIDAFDRKELRCNTLTLSPLDPLVSLWLLVPLACRFYFGPVILSAHSRIPGKLCRGRYGSQASRFVSLSGPGRSSIHTVRIFQAFLALTIYCRSF